MAPPIDTSKRGTHVVRHVLLTLIVLAVVGGLGTLTFLYSGIFNVAATVADAAPLRWVLVTTREASIQNHAKGIEAPAPGGPQQQDNGFRIYRVACAACHTPPGVTVTATALGLSPPPPPLEELVDMSDAELFWVTKNGIRFTGMPASAQSYTDPEIWDLVSFLRASSGMSAADYEALDRRVLPGSEAAPQ